MINPASTLAPTAVPNSVLLTSPGGRNRTYFSLRRKIQNLVSTHWTSPEYHVCTSHQFPFDPVPSFWQRCYPYLFQMLTKPSVTASTSLCDNLQRLIPHQHFQLLFTRPSNRLFGFEQANFWRSPIGTSYTPKVRLPHRNTTP